MDYIILECPHCFNKLLIYKNEINCCIFRHGVYKNNLKQINSHEKKEICDKLKEQDLIFGCGKPFKISINNNYKIEKCDYL